MKKFSALLALFSLAFAAGAEQAASWSFNDKGTTITDGEWTFAVSRRSTEAVEGVYELWLNSCSVAPSVPSTLDLSKQIPEFEGNKYAITSITPSFTVDQKDSVGRVVLPTDVDFKLNSSAFQNCTNLTEVTPFLPANCISLSGYDFYGCTKLSIPLVYTGSAQFEKWSIFERSGITSVDLSGSGVTNINRGCFASCTSLTNVYLPACLRVLTGGTAPFSGCTALRKVEFRSFVGLNVFGPYQATYSYPGCTNLTEVHFYDCVPETTPANVYNGANSGTITTYLHISEDQESAWAQYTQGGVLDANSTWSKTCAGNNYANRPLIKYFEKHVQVATGVNAVVVDDQKGTFIISRGDGESTAGALTVNYTVSGEAKSGTDYYALPSSVTIPSGSASATVEVTGIYTGGSSTKGLDLALSASSDYTIVEGKETASINVVTAHREIGIIKVQDAEMASGQLGRFLISRGDGDPATGDLVVHYTVGGSAEAGVAYADDLVGTITIPAGSRSVVLEVAPLNDTTGTGDTTVTIQLQAVGTSITEGKASAEIAIVHADSFGGWTYANSSVTDGTWTFAGTVDATKKTISFGKVSTAPGEVSPLNFDKVVVDASDVHYKIVTLDCGFVDKSKSYSPLAGYAEYVGSLAIPEGLTTISAYSLGCLTNATGTLKLPSTLTSVGRMGLKENKNLVIQASEFPQGLGDIGDGAFSGTKITGDLKLPLVTELYNSFSSCSELTSVTFGPNLVNLSGGYASGAFGKCTKLTNVVFDAASSVTITPGGVFNGCTSLTELDLTAVTKIHSPTDMAHTNSWDYAPFRACTGLKKITFGPKLKWLHHLSLYTEYDCLKEVVFLGPPPEFFGTPYGRNPTKTTKSVVNYPTITTYVKNDMVTVTNSAGKCWNDYCVGGKIGNKTTFAAEYIQSESGTYSSDYHPDVSARPLRLLTPPGLILFLR